MDTVDDGDDGTTSGSPGDRLAARALRPWRRVAAAGPRAYARCVWGDELKVSIIVLVVDRLHMPL